MKPHIRNATQTPYICYKFHCDRPVTKDTLHGDQSMLSAYVSDPQGWILVKNHSFDVEYIYRFVSLGGLQAKSMTSQRGTLQDGR